ncbi:hypothetical protein CCACVL1_30148 [Corchorus capsularis]|uniref:RRM domain-containing protein n=1 Tax=Corchorus capsularis TaxID=210143 RepID=A0A1R3FYN6_COCAP|nr:hypothetical protein CCACVL1_30148 [Corchorus capsularis]
MAFEPGKLFVGGISRETTDQVLREHFIKYGAVMSAVVAKDRITKSPRGFGFVVFAYPSYADKALQETHVILGRTVEVKRAIPRSEHHHNRVQLFLEQLNHNPNHHPSNGISGTDIEAADNNNQFRTSKIFVGGLHPTVTDEVFRKYFERFGTITDVVVMHDSSTNRPRGFGFVTFESEETVENVMQKSFHELNGKFVEVKRAVPKEGGNHIHNKPRFGGVSYYNGVQPAVYSSNSHGYGMFPSYSPLLGYNSVARYICGTGVYGSGYPTVGYDRIGYGITPVTPTARGAFCSPVMLGARVFPLPYSSASIYTTYMNGGAGRLGTGYYGNGILGTGVDGKLNQVLGGFGGLPANAMPTQIEGVNLDGDSSEQDQKVVDGQRKPLPMVAS